MLIYFVDCVTVQESGRWTLDWEVTLLELGYLSKWLL
jgi:hypothetical protein